MTRKRIALISGPLSFFIILWLHPQDLNDHAAGILAGTTWIAIWWISEVIPLAATSLLPLLLFPMTGAADITTTAASYGHPYIFLFLGGFVIAKAIERWGLHKRIALIIIHIIGSDINKIILGFMVATAFLSMWISNTATSVMMLPIGLAVVKQLEDHTEIEASQSTLFGKALMLAIAYSASIGGISTLIGTPPNLVFAGIMQETFQIEITFLRWLMIGLPFSVVLLFISWQYLTKMAFQFKLKKMPGGRKIIKRQLDDLGVISFEEKSVAIVFFLTASAWVTKSFILQAFIPAIDDTTIAVTGALALFILPDKTQKRALINWKEAATLPWGVLLLYGGGLSIAESFQSSGLASWIGSQMTALQGINVFLLVLLLIFAINFLTEITSNLATTAMILPVLASMAVALDVHPYIFLVGATIAASCAFMLPVATPPNAVVFGSGRLKVQDMVKTGISMNALSILLLSLFIYFILPLIWEFDPGKFPRGF